MKIYTKTGDSGETSLVSGTRVSKSDERIMLYGELDELNSWLGCVLASLSNEKKLDAHKVILKSVQNNIFNLGSLLACEKSSREKYKLPKLKSDQVSLMEFAIDEMTKELPVLHEFILPGGSTSSSFSHVARTKSRHVERLIVAFYKKLPEEKVDGSVEFLNRLSDYLFVFSRYCNLILGFKDEVWSKN
jgi:cob(I)alamin adenosyltransferase